MKIDSGTGFQFQLQKTSKDINKTFASLSSGKAINSAADDPAGLALINALAAQSSGLTTGNNNISLAQSALTVADGALSQTSDSLHELRDLAVQAANGTLSENDRASLQQQYDQVLGSIEDTATQTSFNGTSLLDGSFNQDIQTGGNAGDTQNVNLGSATTSALGISSTGVSTQAAAQDSIEAIDAAIAEVNSQRANIGASQNTFEFSSNANAIQNENIQAAKSQKEDADYASLQSTLTQQLVKQQAQAQVLTANQAIQKDMLKLIG